MPHLTVRDVPREVLDKLKRIARQNGRSVQQQLKLWLEEMTADRAFVLDQIEASWEEHRETTREDVDRWLDQAWPGQQS